VTEELDPEVLAKLLGLLAHDIRNPLSALQSNVGFVSSVLDGSDPDVKDALSDALASCQGLVDIVDNLEVLAHVLRGGGRLELAPVDLMLLLDDVVRRLGTAAKSHETRLELRRPDAPGAIAVHAQREMLMRAISNLVRNSIQHGGRAPVVITPSLAGGACSVRVEDQGSPVSAELAEQAFTAAGQLVSKSARGGRYGRGLGLFCARAAAEAAGATVRVAETPNGCAFELSLPLAPSA
jgi:two-component system sensor histidine kinase KdpD